jgi:hypothetical protein
MKLFPPPERRGVLFWVVLATAVLTFLTVACCAGLGLSSYRGFQGVEPATDLFMQRWRDGQYVLMYDEGAASWRRAETKQEAVAVFQKLDASLGPPESWTLHQIDIRGATDGSTSIVFYLVAFEKAGGDVTIRLRKEGTSWRVYGFTVNSDALLPGLQEEAAEEENEQLAPGASPAEDVGPPASP